MDKEEGLMVIGKDLGSSDTIGLGDEVREGN